LSTETEKNHDKHSIKSAGLRATIQLPCRSATHSKRSVKHHVLYTKPRTATMCKICGQVLFDMVNS